MVNMNMVSKKTLLLTSCILSLFLIGSGIQASMAATPAPLPSYVSVGKVINGYKLEWYTNITANCSFDSVNVNVTCWTTIWVNNDTHKIIGASLVDKGGNILNKAIDLTKTDLKTQFARWVLNVTLGLSNATINGLKSVWDVMIALLTRWKGSAYNLSQPSIAKADHAALFTLNNRPYCKHVLFASKGSYMLLALDYDIANFTAVPDWSNSTLGNLIMAKFQLDVWYFWSLFGTILVWLGKAADWLASSSVPASSAPAASGKIATSAAATTTDLQGFAAGWANLFGGAIPGYEPSLIIAMTATAVVLIGLKVKKSRKA